jgi:hypothetical protein
MAFLSVRWRKTTSALALWNIFIALWVVAGHPGIRSTSGEGNVLAAAAIVFLWLLGNTVVVVVNLVSRLLRKR